MSDEERESLQREIDATVAEIAERKSVEQLETENAALQAEVEKLTKDRDHWKANAKNQAEIRRVTLTRPDLKERSEYVQQIIAERDALRAKVEELEAMRGESKL